MPATDARVPLGSGYGVAWWCMGSRKETWALIVWLNYAGLAAHARPVKVYAGANLPAWWAA